MQRTVSSFFQPRKSKNGESSAGNKRNIDGGTSAAPLEPANVKRAKRHSLQQWAKDSTSSTQEDIDEGERIKRERRREMFRKKIGGIIKVEEDQEQAAAEAAQYDGGMVELEGSDNDNDNDNEAMDEEAKNKGPKKTTGRLRAATQSKRTTRRELKPMEKQFVQLKRQHQDTIMLVEVGYRYKLFGEDARDVCQFLGYSCSAGWLSLDPTGKAEDTAFDRFASWSFPTKSLGVYVRRLVEGGFKVAVVNQTETAALKADKKKNRKEKEKDQGNDTEAIAAGKTLAPRGKTVFEREITSIQTRGTMLEETGFAPDINYKTGKQKSESKYLACVRTVASKEKGKDLHSCVLAVDVSTGDIVVDEFDDSTLLSELETRLIHISPCEILVNSDMPKPAKKLIDTYRRMTNSGGAGDTNGGSRERPYGNQTVRLEEMKEPDRMDEAVVYVTDFFSDKKVPSSLQRNSIDLKMALYGLIKYLEEFKLEHVFELAYKNHAAVDSSSKDSTRADGASSSGNIIRNYMSLSGNTVSSLEIFRNNTDFSEEGSLFSVMDHTRTPFGQRQLRQWVGRPLVNQQQILQRQEAVEEILRAPGKLQDILDNLTKLGDLEKDLARLHYRRSNRRQLFWMMFKIRRISATSIDIVGKQAERQVFKSELLRQIFSQMPACHEPVSEFLEEIDFEAAKEDSVERFFKDQDDGDDDFMMDTSANNNIDTKCQHKQTIADLKDHIMGAKVELDQYLKNLEKELKLTGATGLKYVTSQTTEYVLEMRNSVAKQKIPDDWIKVSATKYVSRYSTPELNGLRQQLNVFQDQLVVACNQAFQDFQNRVMEHFESMRKLVNAVATLDCLVSLATVSRQRGYVRPEFVDCDISDTGNSPMINIKDGRHPVGENLVDQYISNDVQLGGKDQKYPNTMIITGPNMGGKSSYVRLVGLICIMAQIGAYVPAERVRMGLVDAVHTRMGAYDNLMAGESTFMVELKECCDIMRQATPRSLVILDEIGRGTGTMDGMAIAYAVLSHFITDIKSLTLFITHYPMIAAFEREYPQKVANYRMGFRKTETGNGETITFTYKLISGIAHRSYGLNVARLAGLPDRLVEIAGRKAQEMEQAMMETRTTRIIRMINEWTNDDYKGKSSSGFAVSKDDIRRMEMDIEALY